MIDYNDIDEGIRSLVKFLNEAGFETFASCEGGKGHAFDLPTVKLRFFNDKADSVRGKLVEILLTAGIKGFTINIQYFYQSSGEHVKSMSHIALELWGLESLDVLR